MKTKNKIIFIFSLILFALILIPNKTFASTVASGNCGPSGSDTVKWSLDSNGTLTLSGSGAMGNGVRTATDTGATYSSYWADYQNQVKKVVFEGNITSIGNYAFQRNITLTSIVIPDTVTTIGIRAFAECSNLKDVILSQNLSRIYEIAFYMCTSLEKIEIPESTKYIYEYAFSECTALDLITIKADIIYITSSENTICETAKICALKYSYPYYYARAYGRTFVDMNTGEESTVKVENSDYLELLPTENVKNYGIISTTTMSTSSSGKVPELGTVTCYETDINNSTYKEIKAKVDELTADCTTDREKAKAIFDWIIYNFSYKDGAGASASTTSVYYYWNTMSGNCEAYTILTNFMLSLCDIPTGYVRGLNHAWSIAFVDEEWIYIDSTHYRFDGYDTMVQDMIFAYDGIIYQILDPEDGAYVTGIAELEDKIDDLNSFTFPNHSFAKGICINNFNKIEELKAEAGTAVGNTIQENRYCTGIKNGQVIGKNNHVRITKKENVISATITSAGSYDNVTCCENCDEVFSRTKVVVPALGLPFEDIELSDWFYNAVAYCYGNRIIYGTTNTTYTPNSNITRAELVTIIYRMEGSPKINGVNKFSDVKNGVWYTNAIIWASQNGVINGYNSTTFGPNDNIKREDLAVILCNYTKKVKKLDVSTAENALSSYPDNEEVNGYALSSVKWAVSKGVISGVKVANTRYLNPESTATRAEATGMIYNFCTKIVK